MITLLKLLPDKWEKAKGFLRLDLDRIEAVLNQRWAAVFGDSNLLNPDTIAGDSSTDSRYISNQGSGHTPKWDQVNMANGVTATLKVINGGTGTGVAFTPGSIVFAGVGGVYSQDNANLFWDDTNNRLGVGITPLTTLDVKVDTDLVFRVRKTSSLVELYSANDANGAYVDLTIQAGSLRLEAGNKFVGIGLTATPNARLHFKEETVSAGGIRFGDDAWIYRSAAAVVSLTGSLIVSEDVTAKNLIAGGMSNGQSLNVRSKTELLTIAAAAFTDTAIQFPANSLPLGVSVRVTVVIPTAATFDVGDPATSTLFNAGVSTAATTTASNPPSGYTRYTALTSVRITPNAVPAANTGRVRVTLHYIDMTPPTS